MSPSDGSFLTAISRPATASPRNPRPAAANSGADARAIQLPGDACSGRARFDDGRWPPPAAGRPLTRSLATRSARAFPGRAALTPSRSDAGGRRLGARSPDEEDLRAVRESDRALAACWCWIGGVGGTGLAAAAIMQQRARTPGSGRSARARDGRGSIDRAAGRVFVQSHRIRELRRASRAALN